MSNFPITRAQRTLPGRAAGVRISGLDVSVGPRGEGVVAAGEALFGLGRMLLERRQRIAIKRQQMLDTRSAITGESFITQAIQENEAFKLTNADTSTWEPDLQERLRAAGEQISGLDMSEDAMALLQTKFEAKSTEAMANALVASTRREAEDTKAAVINNLIEAVASNGKDAITEATKKFTETMRGLVDPAEAKETFRVASEVGIKKLNDKTKQCFRDLAAADPDGTTGMLNAERELRKTKKGTISRTALSDSDIEALLNYATSASRRLQTEAQLEQQQRDDAIGERFLGLLINKLEPGKPQLTFNAIAASDLSFDAKKEWLTTLRTFDNYSEEELKEAFTDQGHVLADIYDKIDKGTLTDELDTMVGKGLSPVTAQRIKKEIREPYKKDTEQLFRTIFGWSPELGFENDLSSFLYLKSLRIWEAEVKRQNATGEKIIEIGRSIVRPYFLEHLKAVMPSDTNISRMMELALGEPEEVREEIIPDIEPTPEDLEKYRKMGVKKYRSPSGKLYDLTTVLPKEVPVEKPEIPRESEEPNTYADFRTEVIRLKTEDMKKAREYYDKWAEKFR